LFVSFAQEEKLEAATNELEMEKKARQQAESMASARDALLRHHMQQFSVH